MSVRMIVLCGILIWSSCNNSNTTTKFIYLPKLEHKGMADIDLQLKPVWYQYALIENAPDNIDSLQHLIKHYSDSIVNKAAVEGHYARYFIQFFNHSGNTESYTKGKDDFWDTHNDLSQEMEDYRGECRYEACPTDSLHGVWSIEVKSGDVFQRDTTLNNCKN